MSGISPSKVLKELWCESSGLSEQRMTFKVALWITNYLQAPNQKELCQITEDVYRCTQVEKQALSLIEKWLDFRMNKELRFYTYYAAFILVTEGFDLPNLIEIINQMLVVDSEFHLKNVIRNLFIFVVKKF
jgi:hypothetical protein